MNIPVETSLAAWLRSLDAFDGIPVHTGQSADTIPQDQPVLIVNCENVEVPAAGLYRATVQFSLTTPAVLEDSASLHRSLSVALLGSLDISSADSFFQSPIALSGYHINQVSETREDSSFFTTAEVFVGVRSF